MTIRFSGPWLSVVCTALACSANTSVQATGSDDADARAVETPGVDGGIDAVVDADDVDADPNAPDAGAELDAPTPSVDARVRVRSIDPRRSLVITDQAILARFPLRRVMDQLVAQSQVSGLTALGLFQQWWDTQNPAPGMTSGPHCDATVDPMLGPTLNGFPYSCRPAPAEGAAATCDPFASDDSPCAYIPIGLINRFDLAPTSGAHCGEYRVAYAKRSGLGTMNDRAHVIFEAMLPNPRPDLGLEGCREIAELWADLSEIDDVEARAAALERLYFVGSATVPAVIDVRHLGDNSLGAGQIRTNQFSNVSPWTLREYKLVRDCPGGTCSAMRVVPATDKGNPYGPLFAPENTSPIAEDFRREFAQQVASLAGATPMAIRMRLPDRYNSGQSQASRSIRESNYAANFGAGGALREAIARELSALQSPLTPENIIARAQTQSCSGCHHFSSGADLGGGLRWPESLGFTHISERDTEMVGGVTRYLLSPAMNDVFLPHRKSVLERYLNGEATVMAAALRGPGSGTLGGATTH